MVGAPIKKAAQALELFLRSLPEDSFFNVVSFGSSYDSLFPKSQPNSQSAISAALSFAQNMAANYYGTEIYQCLKWVFENKRNDMPTSVFLLTDGSVWNVDQITELVRSKVEESDDLRLFSLGIGSQVSHNLVETVARAGKGYAQFVTDYNKDGFEKKIIGFLKNALRPPIKDYKVEWTKNDVIEFEDDELSKNISEKPIISFFNEGGESLLPLPPADDFLSRLQFRQSPYDIPPIYQGVRLIVYCILAKGVEPKKSITLSAMSQDGPMRLEIPVDPVTLQGTKMHTLAARKLIQNLEDGTSFLHKHQKYRGKQVPYSVVRNQIISLGKTYSLASRYTSFIAIDERDVDITKEQDYKPLQMMVPNYISSNCGFGSIQSNYPKFGLGSNYSQKNYQNIGLNQPNLSQVGGFAFPISAQPQAFRYNVPNSRPVGGFTVTQSEVVNAPQSQFGGFAVATHAQSQAVNSRVAFGFRPPTQTASQSLFESNTSNDNEFGPVALTSQPLFGTNVLNNNRYSGFASGFRQATQTASQPLFGSNTSNNNEFGSVVQTASQPLFGTNMSNNNGYNGFEPATQTANSGGFGSTIQTTSQPLFGSITSNNSGFGTKTKTDGQSLFGGFGQPQFSEFGHQSLSSNHSQIQPSGFECTANIQPQEANINILNSSTQNQTLCGYQQMSQSGSVFTSNSTDIPQQKNEPTNPTLETLCNFLRFQSFDGKFLPSEEFYAYFKKDKTENNNLKEYCIKNNIDETIWTTSIAIGYLEIIMSSKYGEESELCKEKAERWLEKISGSEKTKVVEIAKEWIRKWVNHFQNK
ncbi:8343_t:CDS:2 [Cetraspora pellucida]|uniref:8343_t:CDS:1 n=1 Tax=Cetraspora pellucida TaxID=1433469 RepID=A0ACA9K3D0_9GLOM|nr:8343_t:CDS:2 [Cetraspora pellucida]